MATPKHRLSKSRTRSRRAANTKLAVPTLISCSNCGNKVLPHRVCSSCGYYKGRQVLEPEEMA